MCEKARVPQPYPSCPPLYRGWRTLSANALRIFMACKMYRRFDVRLVVS